MGKMKDIHIELHNASNLIKWMESRIDELEKQVRGLLEREERERSYVGSV